MEAENTMRMSKAILINGVTGKQGRALVQKLSTSPEFEIFGVTRNPDSAHATTLSRKYPALKLITGNPDHPADIFASTPRQIWGVYSLQAAMVSGFNPAREEVQGKGLIDQALANGVQHFVYSSVDRHGAQSDTNETNVPHFQSKFRIEEHLRQQVENLNHTTATSPMTYTILRLPVFMENFTDDFSGRLMASSWKLGLDSDKRLQLISAVDIAHFAHQAFLGTPAYRNRAISLAGDELTFNEANEAFKALFDRDLPMTFSLVGWAMLKGVRELGTMIRWFNEVGCAADIETLRKENPRLVRFSEWLETSDFAQQK